MSTTTRCTTVRTDAEAEIEVKRSRFLCTVRRTGTEAEARALVETLRKQHWDARHHCSAFVLGPDGRTERSNDDGEPAGTAGAPMLEVLRGAGLTDVTVVVTRWFGGTLLGAGGLVRAYSDAVRAGLEVAGARHRVLVEETLVELAPTEAGRVEADLRTRGHHVLRADWAGHVSLLLGVEAGNQQALAADVATLTSGRSEPVVVGRRWVDLD